MLTLLRKKPSAVEPKRAPEGAECVLCDRTEPGTTLKPVSLAWCSICTAWWCTTPCFSQHHAPASWYAQPAKRSWWKRRAS